MTFLMTMLTGVLHLSPGPQSTESDEIIDGLLLRLSVEPKDVDAQAALYGLMRTPVYAYALSILKNSHDAEDILHDAFIRVCQAASGYSFEGKPMAWIMTVTKRLCYGKLRRSSRMVELSEETWNRLGEEDETVTAEDRVTLYACMEKLSEEERQIVVMHAVADVKHREIAAVLDLPLSTVLAKYHRALKKLRKEMH